MIRVRIAKEESGSQSAIVERRGQGKPRVLAVPRQSKGNLKVALRQAIKDISGDTWPPQPS